MYSFYNRLLKIDLNQEAYRIETLDPEVLEINLGGKGLASYLLYQLNPPGIDPLDPENHLIFATGPVCGSAVWGSSRYGVFTKSPQTGFFSESYSGGKVPESIDATGFDAIIIKGRSARPTVLCVRPDHVEFQEAGDIWGIDSYQTENEVLKRFSRPETNLGRPGAVVIGPAGENLIRFACIKNDHWRSAGRTGVGAVMGSKSLKAIHFQGDKKRSLYDPKAVREFSKALARESKDNPGVKAYKNMGTSQMVKVMNTANAFPTRYWTEESYEHWTKISADALHERCEVSPRACAKCFMACGRMTTLKMGRHAGLKLEGPEYETIYAFGGLCLIDSIEEIAYLNDICDRLGMDTITAGNLCAFTIEAARRGKVQYKIDYGQVDAISELIEKISQKQGIGEILSQGIQAAAKEWNLEDIAVHVKGMEPAGYDPRTLKGMGLGYATSDRGACHLRSTFYKPELSGVIDPEQIEGKAEVFLDYEDRLILFDTLILCRFFRDLYPWEQLVKMVSAVTGINAGKEDLRKIASSVKNQVRRFNMREGLTAEDDRLPKALHRKLKKTGNVITAQELEYMVKDYYRLRGWDDLGRPIS